MLLQRYKSRICFKKHKNLQKSGMSYVYDEDGTLITQTLTGGAQTSWGQSARYIYLPTASGPMPVAANYGTKHYAIQSDHLNTPRTAVPAVTFNLCLMDQNGASQRSSMVCAVTGCVSVS
jgi:hypothetical protein